MVENIDLETGSPGSRTIDHPKVTQLQERLLEIWIKVCPNHEFPLLALGWNIRNNKGYPMGQKISTDGLKRFPENLLLHRLLGESSYYLRTYNIGLIAMKKADSLAPDDEYVDFYYGQTLFALKKYKEALPQLRAAGENLPDSESGKISHSLVKAGRCGLLLKEFKIAKEVLLASLKHDSPEYCSWVYEELAVATYNLDEKEQAKDYVEKAMERNPNRKDAINKHFDGWKDW